MKGLFIDFDGTLCSERLWRSLPTEQHDAIQELFFKDNTEIVHDWMRGKITAEEINKYAAETLGIPYQELWNLFVNDCKTMQVSTIALDAINVLRQKYTVGLVTGNMDCFMRFTVPSLKLNNHFDFISSSYDERKHKTDDDGKLFPELADRFGIKMSDCILIDDQDKCCDLFVSYGGLAYKVNSLDETEKVLSKILDENIK